jgi:pimeloyl-ACP methyl ester carboxylesterase
MDADEITLTVAGSPVRAYRTGAASGEPAVMFLHGGGLDSARLSWQPIWPLLSRSRTLVAADFPGFGGSALGPTPPTLAGYRDWLVSFLDSVELRSAILVGLSLGGGVALRTALDAPGRVTGLVLCAPYGISARTPGGRVGYLAVHAPAMTTATNAVLRRSDPLLRRALHSLLKQPDAITDDLLHEVQTELARPESGIAWAAFQRDEVRWAGPRTQLGAELARITQPVVLMAGGHDRLVASGELRAAAARLRHGRFVPVAGAGHWLARDAPEAVAQEIRSLVPSV